MSWKLTPGAMLGVRTEQLQGDASWALQAAKGRSIQMDINRQDSCQIVGQVAFATITAPPPKRVVQALHWPPQDAKQAQKGFHREV